MGQEFSHEGVNSEHTSYDQYEQEEEKYEEVDVDYMDEDDTNVEPMFDYHGFDEGYNIDSLEDIGMIEFWNIRDEDWMLLELGSQPMISDIACQGTQENVGQKGGFTVQ
ncbi:hypothetical protein S83_055442 [Arachis hypogaea]